MRFPLGVRACARVRAGKDNDLTSFLVRRNGLTVFLPQSYAEYGAELRRGGYFARLCVFLCGYLCGYLCGSTFCGFPLRLPLQFDILRFDILRLTLRNSAVKQNNLHSSTLDQNRTLSAMRNVSGPPAPEERHITRKTPPPNVTSPGGVKLAKLRLLACFLSFF